ncbi:MAG: DEAD/DEAH box helicase [Terricaulis sp.]
MLVATPGRLLDLISQRALKLGEVEIFVLDEADHMLDMGFIHDLKRIAKLLPAKARAFSSRPPCRRPSRTWPANSSPIRNASRWRRRPRRWSAWINP